MAKTANQIIDGAFRWLGILESEETSNAAEGVDALDVLNGMLFNFAPRGIAYTHVTLIATDNLTLADAQLRNVMFLLGNELAPEYEVSLSDKQQAQVAEATNQLQAAYPLGTGDNTALGICYQAFRRLRM